MNVNKQYIPYNILSNNPPNDCDRTCLQDYLHPDEFKEVFGMTREEFYKLKTWRQRLLKKDVNLW